MANSFSQMGHIMPITYLLPTSHLQFYNLPTYPPTYLDVIPTYYLPTHLLIYLPTYPPTHPPTYLLQPTYLIILE
jgi:hypothetical protein